MKAHWPSWLRFWPRLMNFIRVGFSLELRFFQLNIMCILYFLYVLLLVILSINICKYNFSLYLKS